MFVKFNQILSNALRFDFVLLIPWVHFEIYMQKRFVVKVNINGNIAEQKRIIGKDLT